MKIFQNDENKKIIMKAELEQKKITIIFENQKMMKKFEPEQ
jgi:hypothetical protein